MFRGGPAHTGEHPGPGAEGAPALLWRFQTGGDVVSSPAVADGVVYFGSADGYLYAVEAESGRQRWRFQADDGVSSSAAVVDGVIYFGSFDGAFYALDATSSGEEMLPRSLALPARAFTAALIVLVALSRMWAGVHWPSDTHGALLWAALALAVVMAFRPTIRTLWGAPPTCCARCGPANGPGAEIR